MTTRTLEGITAHHPGVPLYNQQPHIENTCTLPGKPEYNATNLRFQPTSGIWRNPQHPS